MPTKSIPGAPTVVDTSDATRSLQFYKSTTTGTPVRVLGRFSSPGGNVVAQFDALLSACPTFSALTPTQQANFDALLAGIFQDLITLGGGT